MCAIILKSFNYELLARNYSVAQGLGSQSDHSGIYKPQNKL